MCKIVRLEDLAMGVLTKILQKSQKTRNMKKNIYEQTDKNCQYPTDAGLDTRTGFVDFVTSDNPHCGGCIHVCFDMDLRSYICRRFGVEVHFSSCCDDWVHERIVSKRK